MVLYIALTLALLFPDHGLSMRPAQEESLRVDSESETVQDRLAGGLHINYKFLLHLSPETPVCDADLMFKKMMKFNAQTRGLPLSTYDTVNTPSLLDVACRPSLRASALRGTNGRDSLFGKGLIGKVSSSSGIGRWPCAEHCASVEGDPSCEGSPKPPQDVTRDSPGAIELFQWLQEACTRVIGAGSTPEDLRETVYEASKFIVWNQVFSDANHRTSLSLVVQALPSELQNSFLGEVIDYRTECNDGTFRGQVYSFQDSVDGHGRDRGQYFLDTIPASITDARWRQVHQVFAPHGDARWDTTITGYRTLLEGWQQKSHNPASLDASCVAYDLSVGAGDLTAEADTETVSAMDSSPQTCGGDNGPCKGGDDLVCCDTGPMVTIPPGGFCKGSCTCIAKTMCMK